MIIVFGSINMDLSIKVKRLPEEGETILSPSYIMAPGGKGANQAMAAARAGAKTAIIGKIGDDGAGVRILQHLKRNEVITSGVAISEDYPTGMAMVAKEAGAKKRTILASGANAEVNAEQAPEDIFHDKNLLLVQMEVPMEQNAIVMKNAKNKGAKVIMNLAPALTVPKNLLSLVDYLIVNQIEARQLAQKLKINIDDDSTKLAQALAKEGKLTCIVTLGPEGIVAINPDGTGLKIPSMEIENVVDTTGAGDCFCGTFAACIHEGQNLNTALRMATVASGLSCRYEGAQESYPYLADIEEAMEGFPQATEI
ncbi:MAG TPA: ribokinase [Alphaproteobacteria bacterium]|nr:ribokinase [Alphaproteobacteria bacterium]